MLESKKIFELKTGDLVRLIFKQEKISEKIWVKLVDNKKIIWIGVVYNEPLNLDLNLGDEVLFSPNNIIDCCKATGINHQCGYYEKWEEHDWICLYCSRIYGLDSSRPPMWPQKKISHHFCQKSGKICAACGITEKN